MPQPLGPVEVANLALANVNQKQITTLSDQNELARMCNRWMEPMRRQLLEECDWTFARKVFKLNLIGEATGVGDFPDWATGGSSSTSGGDGDNDEDDNPNLTQDNDVYPWAYIYQYPPNVLFIHKVYNMEAQSGLLEWSGYAGTQFRTWLETQNSGWELIRSRKTNEYGIACNFQQAICKYTADISDYSQASTSFIIALSLKLAQRICLPLTGDKELKAQVDADLLVAMSEAFRLNHSENTERGPRSSSYEETLRLPSAQVKSLLAFGVAPTSRSTRSVFALAAT
jgi:hypothetical protein